MAFATLVMISNTMFSVFYSVSNLGALNIGSTVIVILLDQFAARVLFGAVIYLVAKIMISVVKSQEEN